MKVGLIGAGRLGICLALLLERAGYQVIASDNRSDFIKRLIGLPGDNIRFLNGELFINNEKVQKKQNKLPPIVVLNQPLTKSMLYIKAS